MNPKKLNIEQKLDELGQTLIRQDSIVEDVMLHIRSRASSYPSPAKRGPLPPLYILKPALILAASIMLAMSLWLALYATFQPDFYRQMKNAINNSANFYQLTENLDNDQGRISSEVWYDRQLGLVRQVWQNGKKVSEIVDNGKNRWIQCSDGTSMQTSSIPTRGKMDFLLSIIERFQKNIDRSPLGDQKIDGAFCECYVLYDPDYSQITRYYIWVDPENRIRLCEIRKLKNMKWHTCERNKIEYNIDIEKSQFHPTPTQPPKPSVDLPLHDNTLAKHNPEYTLHPLFLTDSSCYILTTRLGGYTHTCLT